jgi:hypothetical protein
MVKGGAMTRFSPYFINFFNFFFVFFFLAYIVLKKIIPSYQKQISEEKDIAIERITLTKALEKKKVDLTLLNDEQAVLIIQLQKKISDWYTATDIEQEKKIKFLNQRRHTIHEKQDHLHRELFIKKIQQKALDQSLLCAKKIATSTFATESEQVAYFKTFFAHNSKKVFDE